MNDLDSLKPTTEGRLMAALSHIMALIPTLGAVAPPIIWAVEKERSKYVAFQALQASVYQLCLLVINTLGTVGFAVATIFSSLMKASIKSGGNGQISSGISLFLMYGPTILYQLFLLGYLALVVYGVVGAVLTAMGKPFRYLFIGKRIERFYAKNGSDADERIASSLSHISIFIHYFGLLVPIVIWTTQKGKSKYIAFQALQAFAVQLIKFAVFIICLGICMISLFSGMIASILFSSRPNGSDEIFLILMFVVPMLVIVTMYLIDTALIVYAIVGSVRTARGKPFRYAIIGNWIKRLMREKPDKNIPARQV